MIKDLIDKLIITNGTKRFSLGIFLTYIVFIPSKNIFKYFYDITQIYLWKSNGMSEESIENITKSNKNFALNLLIILTTRYKF